MIPMMNIVAWSRVTPWAEMRQVEQDLIISRAIVELFANPFLREQLRFRGGTAPLMGKKIAVSQSTSGDMPDTGLDVLNQDGDSIEVALAKQLLQ